MYSSFAYAGDEADVLFLAENWSEAALAYEAVVLEDPDNIAAWTRLAVSVRKAQRYDIALNALRKAEEQGFAAIQIGVERVRIDVLKGNHDAAMEGLSALVATDFTAVAFIRNEPILSRMVGDET